MVVSDWKATVQGQARCALRSFFSPRLWAIRGAQVKLERRQSVQARRRCRAAKREMDHDQQPGACGDRLQRGGRAGGARARAEAAAADAAHLRRRRPVPHSVFRPHGLRGWPGRADRHGLAPFLWTCRRRGHHPLRAPRGAGGASVAARGGPGRAAGRCGERPSRGCRRAKQHLRAARCPEAVCRGDLGRRQRDRPRPAGPHDRDPAGERRSPAPFADPLQPAPADRAGASRPHPAPRRAQHRALDVHQVLAARDAGGRGLGRAGVTRARPGSPLPPAHRPRPRPKGARCLGRRDRSAGRPGGAGFHEVAIFHRGSRTLVLTDLVQNWEPPNSPGRSAPLAR